MRHFTVQVAHCYTDEWLGSHHGLWPPATVCHAAYEWARDDDGDGVREVHVNTIEGLWTAVRNFLRPFTAGHKQRLSGYVAIAEFRRNHKHISPEVLLVTVQPFTR